MKNRLQVLTWKLLSKRPEDYDSCICLNMASTTTEQAKQILDDKDLAEEVSLRFQMKLALFRMYLFLAMYQ